MLKYNYDIYNIMFLIFRNVRNVILLKSENQIHAQIKWSDIVSRFLGFGMYDENFSAAQGR